MPSRRTLLGGLVIVAAAGAGAAIGRERPRREHTAAVPATPPAWLMTAIERERQLLAGLQAALATDAGMSATLNPVINDHNAHLMALLALPGAGQTSPSPTTASSPAASATPAPGPGRAALAAAETAAATATAAQSAAQTGSAAVLLASIAACEATHGQLLS